ncbi:MAG: phosphoglycerate kinase [Minisyncoccales bacterium]
MIKIIPKTKVKGKKVIVRCDYNCPLDAKGKILDTFRIEQSLPTLKYLLSQKSRIIIITHLGRPEGKKVEFLKLDNIKKILEKLILRPVKKLNGVIEKSVKEEIEKMQQGEIVLLENIRFYPEEEKGDLLFAQKIASLGEVFVQDAFSVCHRDHASVTKITKFLPSFAGLLLEKEVKSLEKIKKNPRRPLIALIGGKKEEKFKILNLLSKKADLILTNQLVKELFLKKKETKKKERKKIIFPFDSCKQDLDKKTIMLYTKEILKAKTIFWAGPMGKIEEKKYQKGSRAIARAIVKSKAFSVVGGGDTVEFLRKIKMDKKFSFLSTGGSAMIEFLSGKKLPGLKTLGYYGN